MLRTNTSARGEPAFWVKGKEAELARCRRLTVIIRPGDRSSREEAGGQWLPLLTSLPVYYITVSGDPSKNVSPQFAPDDGTALQIVRRTVGQLGDVVDADLRFAEGTAVPVSVCTLRGYLEEELSPGKQFLPGDLVTIYWIKYLPNEIPASD